MTPGMPLAGAGADGNKEVDDIIMSKMSKIQDAMGQRLWQCNECDYAKKLKGDELHFC